MTSRNLKLLILGLTIFLSSLLAQNVRAQVPPASTIYLMCFLSHSPHGCGGPATNGFTISVALSPPSVTRGGSSTATVTVKAGSAFSGSVDLVSLPFLTGVSGTPISGTPVTLTPNQTNNNAHFTVTTLSSGTATTYAITVKGTSGALSQQASATLGISATPPAPPCVKAVPKPSGW